MTFVYEDTGNKTEPPPGGCQPPSHLWVYEATPETQGGRATMPAFEKQYDPDGDIPV